MPRTLKVSVALAALLVVTLGPASFASARTDIVELNLVARQVEFNEVDAAPTGGPPSLGDTSQFSKDLYQGGRRFGFASGECTVVRAQRPPLAFQCQATAHLPTGDVTAQGLTFDQATNTLAITGGTKRWRNAGGQVTLREINDTTMHITISINDLA